MNVQFLKQTNVIQTPCAPTLKDRTFVVVKEDILAMAEIAQVNISYISFVAILHKQYNTIEVLFLFETFQPSFLAVLHPVVQTRFVKKVADVWRVSVVMVTTVTDTTAQVRPIVLPIIIYGLINKKHSIP